MNIQSLTPPLKICIPVFLRRFVYRGAIETTKFKQKLMNMLIAILELTLNSCLRNHA